MATLVALPAGSAVLALWLVARRPALLPDSLRVALLHFAFALTLVELVPRATAQLVAEGRPGLLLAFLAVLWALVYAWLAVAAVLRTVLNATAE
jgi:hypothetical protein